MPTPSSKARAAKSSAPKEEHKHSDLEAKIAELEKKIEELKKSLAEHEKKSESEHAELAAKCAAGSSAGGKDLELRKQLKKFFKTYSNGKVPTQIPDID